MKRKAVCMIPAIIALLTAFTGCGPQSVELSDRLIVEAVGIDQADAGVIVTLQALDTHAAGAGSDPNEQGQVTRLYQFSGESVGQALSQIRAATGLTPLYSQARVLLFGRALAETGLIEPLDFFLREYNARSDILIAMAEETAEQPVAADFGATTPGAVIIEDMLNGSRSDGTGAAVKLYDFMNLTYTGTDTAFCPVLGVTDQALENAKKPILRGTAFFKNGRLAFTAGEDLTRGMLFLKDRVKNGEIRAEGKTGTYTMRIVSSKTKISPTLNKNGRAHARIRVNTVCDVTEFTPKNDARRLGEAEAADAAAAGKAWTEALLNDTLRVLFYENHADICRLARLVNLKYPRLAAAYAARMFEDTEITVETEFTVRRTGKEGI